MTGADFRVLRNLVVPRAERVRQPFDRLANHGEPAHDGILFLNARRKVVESESGGIPGHEVCSLEQFAKQQWDRAVHSRGTSSRRIRSRRQGCSELRVATSTSRPKASLSTTWRPARSSKLTPASHVAKALFRRGTLLALGHDAAIHVECASKLARLHRLSQPIHDTHQGLGGTVNGITRRKLEMATCALDQHRPSDRRR